MTNLTVPQLCQLFKVLATVDDKVKFSVVGDKFYVEGVERFESKRVYLEAYGHTLLDLSRKPVVDEVHVTQNDLALLEGLF